MDHRTFLKVKIKSLAEEARIIKLEEARNKFLRASLYLHRIGIVRHEARHTLIAYGFLRGRTYKSIESKCQTKPDLAKIWKMVKRYGRCNQNGIPIGETYVKDDVTEYEEELKKWLEA